MLDIYPYFTLDIIFLFFPGGGSGFIGRHLTKLLTKNGMKVTMVSRSAGPNRITWVSSLCFSLSVYCVYIYIYTYYVLDINMITCQLRSLFSPVLSQCRSGISANLVREDTVGNSVYKSDNAFALRISKKLSKS